MSRQKSTGEHFSVQQNGLKIYRCPDTIIPRTRNVRGVTVAVTLPQLCRHFNAIIMAPSLLRYNKLRYVTNNDNATFGVRKRAHRTSHIYIYEYYLPCIYGAARLRLARCARFSRPTAHEAARWPISRLLSPEVAEKSTTDTSTGGDLLLIIVPRAGTGKTAGRAECPARARKAPTCELAREACIKSPLTLMDAKSDLKPTP